MLHLLKNKLFLLLLVTILIFVIMGLTAQQDSKINQFGNIVSVVLSPLQKFFSISGEKIGGSLTIFRDIKDLKHENDELKAKVDKLEKERMELEEYKFKNKEFRDALNLKDQFNDYEFMGANIIAKDPGNWFNIFNIDRGSKDGISGNFPVITSKGLVGKVTTSNLLSSKVISIIDCDSTVSARISKTRDLVVVKGDITLREQGMCRLDYIPPDVDVSVGDTIETSGLGGIFPKGIIIGRIKEVRQVNNELTRYAIIEPSVDFKRLEEVFVLKSKINNSEVGSTKK